MSDHNPDTDEQTDVPPRDNDDGDPAYDTTEKVERTDRGYRLTVESTRGTGTRDQDTVKAELRSEEQLSNSEIAQLKSDVRHLMNNRRAHQPDPEAE